MNDLLQRAVDLRVLERAIEHIRGDVRTTPLGGPFSVTHDRGCLHSLPRAEWARYVAAVGRLAAPGARIVIKANSAPGASTEHVATGELSRLFGDGYTLEQKSSSSLGSSPVLLTVLRRASA